MPNRRLMVLVASVFVALVLVSGGAWFTARWLCVSRDWAFPEQDASESLTQCAEAGGWLLEYAVTNQSFAHPLSTIAVWLDSTRLCSGFLPTGTHHTYRSGSICAARGPHTLRVVVKTFPGKTVHTDTLYCDSSYRAARAKDSGSGQEYMAREPWPALLIVRVLDGKDPPGRVRVVVVKE